MIEQLMKSLAALKVAGAPQIESHALKNIITDYGNWVIPGTLMCGPTPGPTHYCAIVPANEHKENMDNIIADGIDTFICLQNELDPNVSYASLIRKKGVEIYHYPIRDETAPPKLTLLNHIAQVLDLIRRGRRIYIHCAGGHGRTSLYVCCILACLYKELRHFDSVLYYVQSVHNLRRKQNNTFYGVLPCMICCAAEQRDMLKDFLIFLSFL